MRSRASSAAATGERILAAATALFLEQPYDEVSLAAPTMVRVVEGEGFAAREWSPDEFGLDPVRTADITADGPAASAAVIRAVLNDEDGPARRIVLANAAAALWAADQVRTLREGVGRAADALRAGKPRSVLEQLARMR